MRSLRTLLLGALLLLAACQSWKTAPLGLSFEQTLPGVSFSSTPPGARVYLDGSDTGFTTPCVIGIDSGSWHRVDIELDGFRTESRALAPDWQVFYMFWSDTDRGPRTWRFPMWLPGSDLLKPIQSDRTLHPSRIHVKLELAGGE